MTTTSRPPVGETRIVLADGREVAIRELLPTDEAALVTAIESADEADLRRRFMGGPPPVSALVERLKQADGWHNFGLGAFTADGELVGVAQFDRVDDDSPTAEIAIEVANEWQTQGLGTALLQRLAECARERGVHRFTATFFADNAPLRRLLRDFAPLVQPTYEAGQGFLELDLDRA
jgi:RimJ/RimL family protein N-acetyltransferase